nr:ATP synthase F0 subunit 8 [Pristiapogon kallopterus]
MPQLDPNPWLMIMMFTWLVFLVPFAPKTLTFIFPNGTTPQAVQKSKTNSWDWPWH